VSELRVPSRRAFYRALAGYSPSPDERFAAADPRFGGRDVHYVLKNRERLWEALRAAARHCPRPTGIVDLGVHPGSLLRLVKWLAPGLDGARYGVGLKISDDFAASLAREVGARLFPVNLDPGHPRFGRLALPTTVPVRDGAADLVFALEIVEHLTDPTHLLGEARRLLRPGGILIVTTPNVSRIGSVLKLLAGRTNHDRLVPPGREADEAHWAPHVREYAMDELCALIAARGFALREARYFPGEATDFTVRSPRARLAGLVKRPFFVIPHLRGSLLVAACAS
jgi:SAM-dependent methyltransferase